MKDYGKDIPTSSCHIALHLLLSPTDPFQSSLLWCFSKKSLGVDDNMMGMLSGPQLRLSVFKSSLLPNHALIWSIFSLVYDIYKIEQVGWLPDLVLEIFGKQNAGGYWCVNWFILTGILTETYLV